MKRVLLRMPFESEGNWAAEIDRSVERDIERLQSEIRDATPPPSEDDRNFLKALEAGDVDYETIFRAAAPAYVAQFSESASAVLGLELDSVSKRCSTVRTPPSARRCQSRSPRSC